MINTELKDATAPLNPRTAILRDIDGDWYLFESARSRKPVSRFETEDGVVYMFGRSYQLCMRTDKLGRAAAAAIVRHFLTGMEDFN